MQEQPILTLAQFELCTVYRREEENELFQMQEGPNSIFKIEKVCLTPKTKRANLSESA